jgi:uncharacterized caspase-like protein
MRRFRLIAVGLLAVGWIAAAEATEQKRVALVIGNSDYTALTTLNNPASDAGAIGAALRKQGFDVILHHDLDRGEFLDALDEIRAEAIGADVAVVYYAGHGMEVGGVNIVAPVDADIDCETAQARRTVALEQLFAAVSPAKNQIVLLDSCRNDPFPQCKVKGANEGGFRGLDRVSTHDGALLVANATLPGRLAADGPAGKHSPFAAALLDRFAREPGKFLYQNLNDAAGDVRAATNGAQIPEILTRGGLPEICLASKGCDAGGGSSNEAALRDEIDALRQQLASGSQAGPDKAIVVEPGS